MVMGGVEVVVADKESKQGFPFRSGEESHWIEETISESVNRCSSTL